MATRKKPTSPAPARTSASSRPKPAASLDERGDAAPTGPVDTPAPLKKQELLAQVIERSDIPKRDAKPVVEAMLAVLGDALAEGRELNLKPMGKIKRKRVTEGDKARVIVASIRQPHAAGTDADAPVTPKAPDAKEAVADDAEER